MPLRPVVSTDRRGAPACTGDQSHPSSLFPTWPSDFERARLDCQVFDTDFYRSCLKPVTVVRPTADAGGRELVPLRWGLIPSWSKDPKIATSCINARGETVAEKPAFRTAFKKR